MSILPILSGEEASSARYGRDKTKLSETAPETVQQHRKQYHTHCNSTLYTETVPCTRQRSPGGRRRNLEHEANLYKYVVARRLAALHAVLLVLQARRSLVQVLASIGSYLAHSVQPALSTETLRGDRSG